MFRYPADRIPALVVLAVTAATFAVYGAVAPGTEHLGWMIGFGVVMAPLRAVVAAWSHHHQHCFTFKSTALNRLLELCYATQTGITTHLWVLHHVLGHHLNYLDQTRDQSRWMRKDGRTMGVWAYIFSVTFTAYWRAFQVGRRHPKQQRVFLTWVMITAAMIGALALHKPVATLVLFVIPMVTTLMWVTWVTYDHHAGLDTQDPWRASYNIEHPVYNWMTCNLGYHTAHHHKQGIHWSKLPQLHAEIRHKIPEDMFVKSTFDVLFPRAGR